MSSAVSSSTNSTATDTSHSESIPAGSNVGSIFTSTDDGHLLHPRPERALIGRYVRLEKSDERDPSAEKSTEDVSLTPRHGSRREGFSLGSEPTINDPRQTNRNPLGPDQTQAGTPPPLADIIRRMTNSHPYNLRETALSPVDSIDLHPEPTCLSRSSTISGPSSRMDARRSSIATFAKGIARHVPDLRIFAPPETLADEKEVRSRRDSCDVAFRKDDRRDRKLSIALPSAMKPKKYSETTLQPVSQTKAPSEPDTATPVIQPHLKGSLKDRRKVKLDLSLPTEIPDLPLRSRPPAGALSNITPPRPRSPKTPWIRNEPPAWEIEKFRKSTPITEEEWNHKDIRDGSDFYPGFLPGNDVIFSPNYGHQVQKPRDRLHNSRPKHNRSRSGRSGTSDSTFGHTPDDQESQADTKIPRERQVQIIKELQELGIDTKTPRLRRWRWGASSDELLQSPESATSQSSFSPFKRSNRLPAELKHQKKKQSPFSGRFLFRRQSSNTRPDPMSDLSHMPVPPQFVPPGLQRVPTPPIFDANGEVKGKLADFFFDVHGTSAGRKKPARSPGGVWDSDTLLMSLSSDIDPSDEEDEEGPEGPLIAPIAINFDVTSTPGLITRPGGDYLGVRQESRGVEVDANPAFSHESWFRIPHNINAPDVHKFVLKEEEERRKFEWVVPEHLPNSPLCPLHPKYKGSCKGVCLWHSSRKSKNRLLSR